MSAEYVLQEELELLKSRVSETPDLYVQACYLLFFGHGIMPTATKLYQFLRKGSMTTVSEAVKTFWGQVRDKSRILVEHGGLPNDVREFAGEMLAELWRRSLAAAEQSTAALREEAAQQVLRANQALENAADKIELLEEEKNTLAAERDQARTGLQVMQQKMAAHIAQIELLERELAAQRQAGQDAQQALAAARADFTQELAKAREAVQAADQRFVDAQRTALVELDRVRTENRGLRKQLEDAQVQNRTTAQQYEGTLASNRESIARLEMALQAADAERDRLRLDVSRAEAELRTAQQNKEVLQVPTRRTTPPARPRVRAFRKNRVVLST